MAIQFHCPACGQPIEVDSEWGGQPVDCPYCRKRVTAPLESTYSPGPDAPVARPAAGAATFEAISAAPAVPRYVHAPGRNRVAVWALVLSLSALACLVAGNIIIAMHWDEIEPLTQMSQEGKSLAEINQAFVEQFQNAPPGWLLGFVLVMVMACALWLAGVVCGILGLLRAPRSKFAIAALVVSGLVLLPILVL